MPNSPNNGKGKPGEGPIVSPEASQQEGALGQMVEPLPLAGEDAIELISISEEPLLRQSSNVIDDLSRPINNLFARAISIQEILEELEVFHNKEDINSVESQVQEKYLLRESDLAATMFRIDGLLVDLQALLPRLPEGEWPRKVNEVIALAATLKQKNQNPLPVVSNMVSGLAEILESIEELHHSEEESSEEISEEVIVLELIEMVEGISGESTYEEIEEGAKRIRSKLKILVREKKSTNYVLAGALDRAHQIQKDLKSPTVDETLLKQNLSMLKRELGQLYNFYQNHSRKEAESRKDQLLFGVEEEAVWPYKSREEFDAVKKARECFSQLSLRPQARGMEILRQHGLAADVRWDFIHQKGNHLFSKMTLEEPNIFARRFADRTKMGPGSLVVDWGCGAGADSVLFAKTGAKVIAIDSSAHMTEQLKRNLEFYPKLIELLEGLRTGKDIRMIEEDHTVTLTAKGKKKIRSMLEAKRIDYPAAISTLQRLLKAFSHKILIETKRHHILKPTIKALKDALGEYKEAKSNITVVRGEVGSILRGEPNSRYAQQLIEGMTHCYGYSAPWQYSPPLVSKELLRRQYALQYPQRFKGSYFGNAMKTDESASASIKRHYRLTSLDDKHNFLLDREDRIPRMYPTEDKINKLFTRTGYRLKYATLWKRKYDREDENEYFLEFIGEIPEDGPEPAKF